MKTYLHLEYNLKGLAPNLIALCKKVEEEYPGYTLSHTIQENEYTAIAVFVKEEYVLTYTYIPTRSNQTLVFSNISENVDGK